jgi:hypothetical protein
MFINIIRVANALLLKDLKPGRLNSAKFNYHNKL